MMMYWKSFYLHQLDNLSAAFRERSGEVWTSDVLASLHNESQNQTEL